MDARDTDQWNDGERDSRKKWPSRLVDLCWSDGTRTPLQKETRAGESRRVRDVCLAAGSGRRGSGVRWRQDALGEARRLRGAPRLPVEDSTGSVPLQSG